MLFYFLLYFINSCYIFLDYIFFYVLLYYIIFFVLFFILIYFFFLYYIILYYIILYFILFYVIIYILFTYTQLSASINYVSFRWPPSFFSGSGSCCWRSCLGLRLDQNILANNGLPQWQIGRFRTAKIGVHDFSMSFGVTMGYSISLWIKLAKVCILHPKACKTLDRCAYSCIAVR
jgi:hypothetical protein